VGKYKKNILIVLLIGFVFTYGVAVGIYKIFPFEQIQVVKKFFIPEQQANILAKVLELRNNEFRRISLFEEFSPKVDVVFVGDSITEGAEWSDFFPSISVANRGVGSDITIDILRRLDSIVSLKPDYAFIMVGINDIYLGVPLSQILGRYAAIVESLRKNGIEVVIQSTIQCQPSECFYKSEIVNELNASLKQYAKSLNIRFVKLGVLSKKDGLESIHTYDGVHLNGKGYRVWVESISPILRDMGLVY
jgi:lysophospholipase L1-like esterase